MQTSNRSNLFVTVGVWIVGVILHVNAAPVHLVDEKPVHIVKEESGLIWVDFGRVAFGNLRLTGAKNATNTITVHFGEAATNGRINRTPPGSVRYNKVDVTLSGKSPVIAAPLPDKRKAGKDAILTPAEWGVVTPFRWIEIDGWEGELLPEQIVRQSAFAATWNDDAAAFESSSDMLNQIWELCRYSIKATTFAGVYVDGDRERIPYEGDAYLNQLSHYYTDDDIQMARDTLAYLMKKGTWPTEWTSHLVFMAYADWMQTGDKTQLMKHYEELKTKLLKDRKGSDGLITSNDEQIKKGDLIDWPGAERDGYVFTSRNTVVNAFALRALYLMKEIALVTGKEDESAEFESEYARNLTVFNQSFFDAKTGLYKDGIETDHSSLHANLFPLAFGLVPEDRRVHLSGWLAGRGMACSVYAAQYLMEALFENGAAALAIELMMANNDRSWRHMVESGTTITWEAWDQKYKKNQDWNHAWGAAPANLLPRYILGAQPLSPGWKTALIRPNCGPLLFAKGKVPTPSGPIVIDWKKEGTFTLSVTLPEGMRARVELPVMDPTGGVYIAGAPVNALRSGDRWVLEVNETAVIEVK